MSGKIRAVFIVGPTASGKTDLGARVAKQIGGEVICADSMQIYRGMPIASAAPTAEETLGVPHHLFEFLPPDTEFTVADYVDLARKKATQIAARGKTPVFVGGTGLYINSIIDNIEFVPQKTDADLRCRLGSEFDQIGGEKMLERVREIDPAAAEKLHPNDKKRIIRALEIFMLSGNTVTEQNILSRRNESPFEPTLIGITYSDREKLYERINLRVDKMLERGLLDEARRFYEGAKKGGAVQAIGHKELFPFFAGEKPLEECVETLKQSTRRYAKRQLTWFRRDERINWVYPDLDNDALEKALCVAEDGVGALHEAPAKD